MEHRELEELITPYLLGDATPEQAERVQHHLDDCESCRALAQELELTLDLLRGALAADDPAPVRLDPKRREAIFRSRAPGWIAWFDAHRRMLEWAGAAAAVLVILGVMLVPVTQRAGSMASADATREPAQATPQQHREKAFGERFEAPADREEEARKRFDEVGEPLIPSKPAASPMRRTLWMVSADEAEQSLGQARFTRDSDEVADLDALPSLENKSFYVDDYVQIAKGQVYTRGSVVAETESLGRTVDELSVLNGRLPEEVMGPAAGAYGFGNEWVDASKPAGSGGQREAGAAGEPALSRDRRIAGKDANSLKRENADTASPSQIAAGTAVETSEAFNLEEYAETPPVESDGLWVSDGKDKTRWSYDGITVSSGLAPSPDSAPVVVGGSAVLRPNEPATVGDDLQPVFLGYGVNPYWAVADQPVSTFGIDVDTASYTLARRYILSGSRPPPEAVRTEEFVNFFDYDYRPPSARTFAVVAAGAPAPFGEGVLLQIGVKGKRLGRDDQKASVLTFVVDTSGSMDTAERLGLVKKSLLMLIGELDPADRVAIVQVDSEARLILEHTPAAEAGAIRSAIEGLQCSGSTHLDAGIVLGYDVATRGFVGGAVNRVLILSDGAANLGSANPEEILARVEASRKQGILCSVFGFGLGTYNDVMLETLANRGDGVYRFIDSEDEARRVFVDDLSAALQVIARDVKIQVEFDPRPVAQYRQLGYENRQLQAEDFRNDAIDAGEVGSGQSVTALYELILTGETDGPLGTVRIRYRDEDSGKVEEITREIRTSDLHASAAEAGARFQLAAGAAEFAELLRNSPFAADGNYDAVADLLRPVALELHLDQRASELLDLVQRAGRLPAP